MNSNTSQASAVEQVANPTDGEGVLVVEYQNGCEIKAPAIVDGSYVTPKFDPADMQTYGMPSFGDRCWLQKDGQQWAVDFNPDTEDEYAFIWVDETPEVS